MRTLYDVAHTSPEFLKVFLRCCTRGGNESEGGLLKSSNGCKCVMGGEVV